MGSPQIAPPAPVMARGTARQFAISSCSLAADDLRKLYAILERRANEASTYEIGTLIQQAGQTAEQFAQAKEAARILLKLAATVYSSSGDWIGNTTGDALADSNLPDSISQIVYDSAFLYRAQLRVEPQNSFTVILDFSRTHVLDLTNLSMVPDPNKSSARISGANDAWVKATHDDLFHFFRERKTARGWLYFQFAYDFLVWFIGLPAALAAVYRIGSWTKPKLNLPISVAAPLYVMFFLLCLLIFRVVFNYAKWVFPKLEGPNRRAWPAFHKVVLGIAGASIISLIIESIVRILAAHLFGT